MNLNECLQLTTGVYSVILEFPNIRSWIQCLCYKEEHTRDAIPKYNTVS